MRVLLLTLTFLLTSIPTVNADCEGDTCIDVSADQESNQVVITVKKGKAGTSSTSSPRPRARSTARKLFIPWLPKPVTTAKPRPRPSLTVKPRVKKISGSQISDQVRSLLPSGLIITQPLDNPLVQEPVNFMTTVPTHFSTVIVVLRIPITIHLTALYEWDFGDGRSITTRVQGAPYPLTMISNTYRSSGEKDVRLTIKWSGRWSAGGMSAPINGGITQSITKRLTVRSGRAVYIS
ncbi:MAG: hypothetical protein ACK4WP_02175 [Candidatus Nanopelagicaceae bacterium]|jgi:hypothetical protein